jgi:hypothetical protein
MSWSALPCPASAPATCGPGIWRKKVGIGLGYEVLGWAVAVDYKVAGIQAGELVFLYHHVPCSYYPGPVRLRGPVRPMRTPDSNAGAQPA